MILSNVEIVRCLNENVFSITPRPHIDATQPPYNTTAIDLRLGDEIIEPNINVPAAFDLSQGSIAKFLKDNSTTHKIAVGQSHVLSPNKLILARTLEVVYFPLNDKLCYSARVEGKSSLARCGLLIHFTAPTIHAGFQGSITLEIMNFGNLKILLTPGMKICQLIIEEVKGIPVDAPNQFKGQVSAVGKTT
jgi:dCTP deaminase